MNDITRDKLQRLTVPTASMKSHQAQLKQALLVASRPEHTTNLKQGWRDLMSKKKFVVSGATLAVTALVIVVMSLFGTQSPAAYAEQLAAQGVQKISQLSPNQQQALNQRLNGANALDDLKTAEHAKDLTVLTYAQLVTQEPQVALSDVRVPSTTGSTWIDVHSLKFLRYSDAQGSIHILGVDSQGLPALEMIFPAGTPNVTASPPQSTGQQSNVVGSTNAGGSPAPAATSNSNSGSVVVKPAPSSAPAAPTPSSSSPPSAPTPAQTPLSVLTGIIAGLNNGVAAQVTAANVAIPGSISTAQGRPIVFTANGQTYFAYTQGQEPNFSTTPSQTASSMALVVEPASDSGVALTSAYLDKGNILVDPDQAAVGYATGGN